MRTYADFGLENWAADYICALVAHHGAYDWTVNTKAACYSGYNALTRASEDILT